MPILAYLELTLAQCAIAVAIVLAKLLTDAIPVVMLLSLRFLLCGLIIMLYAKIKKLNLTVDNQNNPLTTRDWQVLFVQAMCGGMFFNFLMIGGLQYTTATTAGIITSTIPAAITILSVILLKEAISRNQIIAVLLAVIGLMILTIGKHQPSQSDGEISPFIGDFLIFLAIFPESMLTIIAKWYGTHVRPMVMASIVLLFNAALFVPFFIYCLFHYTIHLQAWQTIVLFFYALASVAFYRLWYDGIREVTASTAALFTSVMPVATMLMSYFFLAETISVWNLLGMAMIILSIIFGSNRYKPLSKAL